MTEASESDAVDCIRYMSSILHNARWRDGADTTSDHAPLHSARFLNHLAVMLDTGAHGYSVAVTGAAGPQSTDAVVLLSSDSGDAGPQALSGLEFVPVQIRSARKEEDRAKTAHALQHPVPAPVPRVAMPSDLEAFAHELLMEEHVADVLSFLEYARASDHESWDIIAYQLMLWLVFRCWPKMALRFNSAKEWKMDAIVLMRAGPRVGLKVKSSEVLIPTQCMTDLLSYGLFSDEVDSTSKMAKYTLTEATAPAWLKYIGDLVDQLRRLLPPNSDPPHPNTLKGVDRLLRVLALVLGSKATANLFVDNEYWSDSLHAQFFHSDATHLPETDDAVPLHKANFGRYLFRWLKSLIAWHVAVANVIPTLKKHQRLKATLVRLTKEARMDLQPMSSRKDQIIHDIRNTPDRSDDARAGACEWIEARTKAKDFYGNVHAEAGLLALAYISHQDSESLADQPRIRKVFEDQDKQVSIGVSKRCCWLCHRLGDLLFKLSHNPTPQPRNSESTVTTAASKSRLDIALHLPGTHGIVFAWEPPSFGIPTPVLQQLAQELTDRVKEVAFEMGAKKETPSQQSSSISSVKALRILLEPPQKPSGPW